MVLTENPWRGIMGILRALGILVVFLVALDGASQTVFAFDGYCEDFTIDSCIYCDYCEEEAEEECLLEYSPYGEYCDALGYEGYIACADVGPSCGCEPGPPCCAMICQVVPKP